MTKRDKARNVFLGTIMAACAVATVSASMNHWGAEKPDITIAECGTHIAYTDTQQCVKPDGTIANIDGAPILTQADLNTISGNSYTGPAPVLTAPDTH